MSKFSCFDFLGVYNKSYKSARVDMKLFDNFLNELKKFYLDSDSKKDSEENLKIKFAQSILKNYHYETDKNRVDLTITDNGLPQVICEFKTPKNKSEMLQCGEGDINKKSLHETIWYFYNQNSLDVSYGIKNIVITDTDQIFFFNSKHFADKHLEKICLDFKNNKLAIKTTDKLYPLIGQVISARDLNFDYCCFDLKPLKKKIKSDQLTKRDIDKLKILFKLLHRNFLLREFNPKDANELNENFYKELLYIFGLKETKEKGKVTIELSDTPETIGYQIKNTLNCEKDEDAIKLITIWLNRILFLKLFEGQLISFNGGNKEFAFLSSNRVKTFSSLNNLFFNVLGKSLKERTSTKDNNIPYLNSSLFELHPLERRIGRISNLQNEETIKPYSKTVLKRFGEKKDRNILEYLLDFLDSYSFTSVDDSEHKEIINSAVLGLIFEKLNGYKDGSFFTPGYVTEFMAKNAVDRVVLTKFNAAFPNKAKCETIEDVESLISYDRHKKDRREFYNTIIDSIRICDPACGSGHFLVSVLNYLVYLKSYLGLLPIANEIEIHNDSLVIFDSHSNEQFLYQRDNKESTKIQKTLFNEKANIIKNCLFGVDINPNSVEICRLRLWIELLKNAYYKDGRSAEGEMALLPNIDINIKCGNSLISAYPPKVGKTASPDGLFLSSDIKKYQNAVLNYKNEESKTNKKAVVQQIEKIKDKLFGDLFSDVSSQNTLEWMVEFPEVLNDKGVFEGFDLIIGNPPYGVSIKGDERKLVVEKLGKVPDFEIFYFFIELAKKLAKDKTVFSYIVPNSILFNTFAKDYRTKLLPVIYQLVDCSAFNIFQSAVVRNAIIFCQQGELTSDIAYFRTNSIGNFMDLVSTPLCYASKDSLLSMNQNWSLFFNLDRKVLKIVEKIKSCPNVVSSYFDVTQGYIPYRKSDLIKEYGEKKAEEIVSNREWHSNQKLGVDYIQEIFGHNVGMYSYDKDSSFVKYGEHVGTYVPMKYFTQRRLLVKEITNPRVCAGLVTETMVNDPQLIVVIPNKEKKLSLDFLWAILNSNLSTFFHFNHSPKAMKGLFPKILVQDIKQFPLPQNIDNSCLVKEIENSARKCQELFSQGNEYQNEEKKMNDLVCKLYGLNNEDSLIVDKNISSRG